MKILFLGDSFSTNYSEFSWPSIVSKHFKCKDKNLSVPASSLNFSYRELISSLITEKFDVVIFTMSHPDRLYHKDMLIHPNFPQTLNGEVITGKTRKIIDRYYSTLHDFTNSKLSFSILCRCLAQISLEYPKTKFILISGFDRIEKMSVGNCVVIKDSLLPYAGLDKEAHQIECNGGFVKDRHNHLTIRQNQTLADQIIKFIENYKFNCIEEKKLYNMEILK